MKHLPSRREALASFAGAIAGAALTASRATAQSTAPVQVSIAPDTAQAFVDSSSIPLTLADYERLAATKMSFQAREFIDSGSADELTLRSNREALARLRLHPRVMIDVTKVDTSITLFGKKMAHPILLAPTAAHMLVNPAGEVATATGAAAANALLVASTLSNRSIEEINAAAKYGTWFQLYVAKDRGLTRALIERAEAAGSEALCITVDLPVVYGRERVDRINAAMPPLPFPNLNIDATIGWKGIRSLRSAEFGWKDLEWLRSFAKTPILLKGILHAEDADIAVRNGVHGIIVSNHGGRALDAVPATIEALPRVVERVAGRVPVLVDGGFRRGTDIVQALAQGASAILVGRPYLYGLAVNGADGVRHAIEILRTELQAAMGLCGCTSMAAVDRTVTWR